MDDAIRCPDCGAENPRAAESCQACGFPLAAESAIAAPPGAPPEGVAPEPVKSPYVAPTILPPRRRPPRPGASSQALSLWLVFGTIMALVVLFIGIKANVDRARPAVEGSSGAQQASVDSLMGVLEKDSTNVQARVRLGDILYDTGNWSDAIVQYRAAVRQDSSQAAALVDLGVCYYNLGQPNEAERHFELALARDPGHPVALFNLGIVNERRENYRQALEYFHRSLQASPPEPMRQALIEAMSRVQDKAGVQPPPLPGSGG